MSAYFPVLLIGSLGAVSESDERLGRPFLYKNIVIETIVSVKDGHKAPSLLSGVECGMEYNGDLFPLLHR